MIKKTKIVQLNVTGDFIEGYRPNVVENEIAQFMLWINNDQPIYAKNPVAKDFVRKNFSRAKTIQIENLYRIYQEEVLKMKN